MSGDSGVEKKDDDIVATAIEKAGPLFANVGLGSVVGFCSGIALKKIGKAIAVVVGTGFIALQLAISGGYIEGVNYKKIQEDAAKALDMNQDGVVNEKDVKLWWKAFKDIMTHKLPSAGGFSLGFFYGVKNG